MSMCMRRHGCVFRCICLFLLLVLSPKAGLAHQSLVTYTPDGRPFIFFDIFDKGEYEPYVKEKSRWTLNLSEVGAIKYGADYWASLIGPGIKNTVPLKLPVHTINDANAYAGGEVLLNGYTKLGQGFILGKIDSGTLAVMALGDRGKNYLGPMEVLPHNGQLSHMAGTVAHELGHALGITTNTNDTNTGVYFSPTMSHFARGLVDSDGVRATPGQLISEISGGGSFYLPSTGYAYFQGPNTLAVLSGALTGGAENSNNILGVAINGWEGADPELSHLELKNSMMSHQSYRNYTTYMEAELAILQDIGYTIDRKNFYGRSIYTDGVIIENRDGYSARNASGTAYLSGVYNNTPLGIGLHIYGSNNEVRQFGDILSTGFGAAGIRVDGEAGNNTLSVMPGTKVHANGPLGTGLMVTYGTDHTVINRGDIAATGPGGVGVRFDFGSNFLGYVGDYRGSYIFVDKDVDGNTFNDTLLPEIDGPLVQNFSVTGTIKGNAAAIYISENAYVQNIAIMNGAQITGDIISKWNPYASMVQAPGDNPEALMTSLDFGFMPDPTSGASSGFEDIDFNMTYKGNIIGPDSLKMTVHAGKFGYQGKSDVRSFTLKSGTRLETFASWGTGIHAQDITLETGSRVGVRGNNFSYGPVLGSTATMLQLNASSSLINQSQAVNSRGGFAMGAYDYSYTNVRWDTPSQLNVDLPSRKFNTQRGGTSAVTAPLAIAVQNPASSIIMDRMAGNFARRMNAESSIGFSPFVASYGNGINGNNPALQFSTPLVMGHAFTDSNARIPEKQQPQWVSFLNGGGELRSNNSSLWIAPYYNYTHQSSRTSHNIKTPALSLGYDYWFSKNTFVGLSIVNAWPEFSSSDADVSAHNFTGSLYGGVLLPLDMELGVFGSYGRTSNTLKRKVSGERYRSHYSSENASVGTSLGRTFSLNKSVALRPFASYEYMHVNTHRADEGAGTYALDFSAHSNNLHRVTSGGDVSWNFGNGAYVSARAYYGGLYGDRKSKVTASFTMDPAQNKFTSVGNPMDEHSLGLGVNAGVPLHEKVRLSFGYNLTTGKDSIGHQGNLNLAYEF